MTRESANQAHRHIRTLYALGAVGGLTDAELVERFLGRESVRAKRWDVLEMPEVIRGSLRVSADSVVIDQHDGHVHKFSV
ncbi:MAG: hypothetical protein NVSMB9_31410 [Isosphaeraceae bacterium]